MKIFGHSVHPVLIVFPLGLFTGAVVFDVVHMLGGASVFAVVAYWMIVAGLIGGLLAAVFGWIDWLGIPSETRAKSVGLAHGLVNSGVMLLFAVSFYLRMGLPERPPTAASLISIAGVALALVGGWLGGELVERLGVGVHRGANANAPSSLETDVIVQHSHEAKKI